jgi:hypothetical protein
VHARLHAQQPARCAACRAACPGRGALALPGTPPAHALCMSGVPVLQGLQRTLCATAPAGGSVCGTWPVPFSPLGVSEDASQLPCRMGDMLRDQQRPAASGTPSLCLPRSGGVGEGRGGGAAELPRGRRPDQLPAHGRGRQGRPAQRGQGAVRPGQPRHAVEPCKHWACAPGIPPSRGHAVCCSRSSGRRGGTHEMGVTLPPAAVTARGAAGGGHPQRRPVHPACGEGCGLHAPGRGPLLQHLPLHHPHGQGPARRRDAVPPRACTWPHPTLLVLRSALCSLLGVSSAGLATDATPLTGCSGYRFVRACAFSYRFVRACAFSYSAVHAWSHPAFDRSR